MSAVNLNPYESGSQWRRWNPHIHAPGTLLNDQFGGNWDGYLRAIEAAVPTVEVLGVTDYLSIECYKVALMYKQKGRLPNVKLLFPNVEFRLSVETDRQKGINLHLLFCPDDRNHISEIEAAMSSLTFEYGGRQYRCNVSDLEQLGRKHNPKPTDGPTARTVGANQFKVTLDQLRRLFRDYKWVASNCIVAVAASNNDGTAGLQKDSSFSALRQEIERFAHVIFSPTPKTREFWLGRNVSFPPAKLVTDYGGMKPCLHGCDAHSIDKTCKPDENRYCWIKGDPTFESLRQAVLEPEERVSIGETSPGDHCSSVCITKVAIQGTPWLKNDSMPLNPGLVAIIGSRGSGKTALADIIAIGADVASPMSLNSSFIYRATHPVNYLAEASVRLDWGDGTIETRRLGEAAEDQTESVRYLSQQFVEQLCSSEGLAIELKQEIERVIFDATDPTQRYDAESFEELANIHLSPIRSERAVAKQAIESTSAQVNAEDTLQARVKVIRKDREDRQKRIDKLKVDMKGLMPKGKEERAKRLADLEAALSASTAAIEKLNRALLRVNNLCQEVERTRKTVAPQRLEDLKVEYQEAGLKPEQWDEFMMVFKGNVDEVLAERKAEIACQIAALRDIVPGAINTAGEPLTKWPQKLLQRERDKVKQDVGIDLQRQQKYAVLQRTLENEQRVQERSATELTHAEGAADRRITFVEKRRALYVQVFQSYLSEQQELEKLYAPLQQGLERSSGSLSRLRFTVSRDINLDAWIKKGEELLDLRRESKLRGHGALKREVERLLLPVWRTGTAEEVGEAMQRFIAEMYPEMKKSRPAEIPAERESAWIQDVATWMYSTDHIQMRYSVTYDGVAIEQLSPGTRGIVLLLLYLVIDQQDRRPLVVDQPEENLDPKSVFDELVPHFRKARKRRQVVIVTHNANLVVNTDADQVIVASSHPNPGGGLPSVTYVGGSIENPAIRHSVCEILEGGEQAFLDRERRYRLQRER